jgi:hypothetical protein
MDKVEYTELLIDMYNDFKPKIDAAITSVINRHFLNGKLSFRNVYNISLGRSRMICNYLFKLNDNSEATYIMDKEKFDAFNTVCERIISEHYKTIAVGKFGYNDSSCFEISEDRLLINIFFRIIP